MTEEDHTCMIFESCILSNNYKLLFCVSCRRTVGYETPEGRRILGEIIIKSGKQKEYSSQTIEDNR